MRRRFRRRQQVMRTGPSYIAAQYNNDSAADRADEYLACPPLTVLVRGRNLGSGERLTHRWGNVLRYCTERGWYYWSGKHWQLDKVEKVNKAALATVRRIVQDELPLHLEGIDGDDEESKKLRDKITGDVMWWAKASEGIGHLNAAVTTCHQIGKGINVQIGVFDQDQWLFNVDNGTLDLRTN